MERELSTATVPAPDALTLEGLESAVACDVLFPDHADYDLHRRVWNADIDRYPAAIVRCRDAADVSAAVRWCVANDVPITVRGGGHNLAGTSVADGAVLIDTALLNRVEFDLDAGTVTIGAGCRWGDVDRAGAPHGRTVPAGVVSHTGVAGLTLGGGAGYLTRLRGVTVDHVAEIEIVVADGRILTASATENPDLFWALKGAGHNFGVATRFVFRTVSVPGLATVRQALYPASDRKGILQFFRDWGLNAPANVGTYVRLLRAPEYWSQIPAEHRGQPILSVATVFYGDPAEEPAATAEMFAQAEPIYTSLRTMPHVTLQHATDDEFRYGVSHYWKHLFLRDLSDDAIDTIIEHCDAYTGRALNSSAHIAHQLMCPFEIIAGSREPRDTSNDSTAGVGAPFAANIGADWEYPGEKAPLVEWAKAFDDALAGHRQGTYINFTSVAGDGGAARAIYGEKYDRLVEIKRDYDPNNVFARGLVDLSDLAGQLA
jgi:FAD/FMN-containing dehydrogenase